MNHAPRNCCLFQTKFNLFGNWHFLARLKHFLQSNISLRLFLKSIDIVYRKYCCILFLASLFFLPSQAYASCACLFEALEEVQILECKKVGESVFSKLAFWREKPKRNSFLVKVRRLKHRKVPCDWYSRGDLDKHISNWEPITTKQELHYILYAQNIQDCHTVTTKNPLIFKSGNTCCDTGPLPGTDLCSSKISGNFLEEVPDKLKQFIEQ